MRLLLLGLKLPLKARSPTDSVRLHQSRSFVLAHLESSAPDAWSGRTVAAATPNPGNSFCIWPVNRLTACHAKMWSRQCGRKARLPKTRDAASDNCATASANSCRKCPAFLTETV